MSIKLKFVPIGLKQNLVKYLKQSLPEIFSPSDNIVIKLHMGEKGNPYYLKPGLVKPIVDTLKSIGANPILFDTPTLYRGSRDTPQKYLETAAEHGYLATSIGCPVIISDDQIYVKTRHFNIGVSKVVAEADGILVASHIKGHLCSGFGGAIKNLGMGCVDKKTKKLIHDAGVPVFDPSLCTGCGNCEKNCLSSAIRMKDNKPIINHKRCGGCSLCSIVCEREAIKPKILPFSEALAEGAYAVLSKVNKRFFINYLLNIAKMCDCVPNPTPILMSDIGILIGKDVVAIDKASYDLVMKKVGYDIFEKVHKISGLMHVMAGEKLGMGTCEYSVFS